MASMLYVASQKTIVIADTMREENTAFDGSADREDAGKWKLVLQADDTMEQSIRIPLEKGTKAESVVMENRYMEQELWIYLRDADAQYYTENTIYGDFAFVEGGYYEENSEGVILKFRMNEVLEYHSTMENDTLVLAYCKPKEIYDQIVVVDPVGGGSDTGCVFGEYTEKEITLQVAKQLQKKVQWENIKVYFTRLEDIDVSYEERLAFVEASDADIFISIGTCEDAEHPESYGIHSFYNEEYFIPTFGNIQVADVLTRNVTVVASNKAIGMAPAGSESILRDIQIPAAEICVGYLSNAQECTLLEQEYYQEKLAEGLAKAIEEIYTNMKTSKGAEE